MRFARPAGLTRARTTWLLSSLALVLIGAGCERESAESSTTAPSETLQDAVEDRSVWLIEY